MTEEEGLAARVAELERQLEVSRAEVMKRISDIAYSLDALFDGKPLNDVCAALALTLIAQLKLHKYPGPLLIEELEKLIMLTVMATADVKETVH